MDANGLRGLLHKELCDLARRTHRLVSPTEPQTPLPRPRKFEFAPRVVWPYCEVQVQPYRIEVHWHLVWVARVPREVAYHEADWVSLTSFALGDLLFEVVRGQPRAVLRALRRVQAAAAWCEARRAGRERAAQEILRRQRWAVEALEAEAVLRGLA